MNEQDVRTLVREAIARHLGPAGVPSAAPLDHRSPGEGGHASHGLFVLPSGLDAGGPCIIEPAVPCNHCGYCKSLGH